MALVFVPKIVFIRKHAHDPREREEDERESREQEMQYKQVLKENEALQKKIQEVTKFNGSSVVGFSHVLLGPRATNLEP